MASVSCNLFFREIPRNFSSIGALLPSSRSLATELANELANKRQKPSKILEVGAGTGAVTRVLISHLMPGDSLDIVEINPLFARALRRSLAMSCAPSLERKKINVIETDVMDLAVDNSYDTIVCTLPFNSFEQEVTKKIFDKILSLLTPGGNLAFFEYWGLRAFKRKLFYTPMREQSLAISRHIDNLSLQMDTSKHFVFMNFPPAIIYKMTKPIEHSRN